MAPQNVRRQFRQSLVPLHCTLEMPPLPRPSNRKSGRVFPRLKDPVAGYGHGTTRQKRCGVTMSSMMHSVAWLIAAAAVTPFKKEPRRAANPGYTPAMNTDAAATNVLDHLLDPVSRCFSLEGARALLKVRADAQDEARITELAEKCNEGQLTVQERREYETYVHVGNLIAILQAKARRFLKQQAAS